jgi:excisionase family DNA binding protein
MSSKLALTVKEAAGRLGVHPETLYDAIRRGDFPCARRLGRRYIVPLPQFEAWLATPNGEEKERLGGH